jgi:hypothetical protein
MTTDVAAVAIAPTAAASAAASEPLGVDERWAAWQAKGAAHDRAVRRKMAFAAPILLLAVAVLYALFGR